jgi:hypothetical protein
VVSCVFRLKFWMNFASPPGVLPNKMAFDLYSGDARLESWTGHGLSRPVFQILEAHHIFFKEKFYHYKKLVVRLCLKVQ